MHWDNDATQLMRVYLEDVRRAANARGADGDRLANTVQQRLVDQVKGSGAEVITADLVRGVLAAAGPAESVAAAAVPPPMPPAGAYAAPPPGAYGAPVARKGSNTSVTCLIAVAVCVGLFVMLSLLAAILLPALARAREAARRVSCQNNMKQVGILFKMYANEHQGVYPPLDDTEYYFTFQDGSLEQHDPKIMQCPSDDVETGVPDYLYFGYAIHDQEELDALVNAYLAVGRDPRALTALGSIPGPRGDILPIQEGRPDAAEIPVLVERTPHHIPGGGNVLYLDGHTAFLKLGQHFPMDEAFFAAVNRLGP